jgi:colanic acid/amylovoran biosynthesis glycosyltransferase
MPLGNWRLSLLAFGYPRRLAALAKALCQTEDSPKRMVRKAIEYLPWIRYRYDIVHFNYPKIATRRLELGGLMGSKTLVSFRGQDLTFYPGLFQPVFAQADWIHFISRHLLTEARKQGYGGQNFSLIPPMVDTDFYHPSPAKSRQNKTRKDRWVFFTAARLFWTKGHEYALQAVRALLERGWDIDYYIAGDGEHKIAVAYTIADLGLEEHVHLLGWLSPEESKRWMQAADLYLLASVEEGFNNGVLQAQACGLPVVCSDAGGLPENVEDGVTGLVARRRDPQDFAHKIECLLGNPELLEEMALRARERAETLFAIDKVTTQFVDLYHRLVSA